MGSMGIQRSPSISIGITGLVINLISNKCSINQICLVLKAMKRNSSFKGRMTRTYTSVFQAFKQNSALRQQIQYAWNVARYLGHEAKMLISSADNETYTSLFYLKHGPMQCTWEMPCFLGHKAKQLISSANDLQRLTALYIGKCSKLGIWLNMPRF